MIRSLAFVVLACSVAAAQDEKKQDEKKKPERAKIDEAVKDFKLKDVMKDEETFVTLSDFKEKKVVVLYFVSDKCQVTWAYERRTGKLMEDFRKKDVVFLGIKSSAADTDEQIRKYCEAKNFEIPVLADDKNVVADYYGVRSTPVYAVIDKKGILRYKGGLDEKQTSQTFREADDTVKNHYVADAITAVLDGKDVATKEAPAYG